MLAEKERSREKKEKSNEQKEASRNKTEEMCRPSDQCHSMPALSKHVLRIKLGGFMFTSHRDVEHNIEVTMVARVPLDTDHALHLLRVVHHKGSR